MSVAEIHGKISGTNLSDRMEDLLTADVFGCLRYLPPELALIPFLNTAESFKGDTFRLEDGILRVHSAFWPWLSPPSCIPCEPDVVLGLETAAGSLHVVMIEAKYFAELSSEADERPEPNDQLAREFDNLQSIGPLALKWDPRLAFSSRTLIYVTQDMAMPRADMARSLDEYERKRSRPGDIYWTNWRLLPQILERSLATASDPEHRTVLEDMLILLRRKGLEMFEGVELPSHDLVAELFSFYTIAPRAYKWPVLPEVSRIDTQYRYEVINHD